MQEGRSSSRGTLLLLSLAASLQYHPVPPDGAKFSCEKTHFLSSFSPALPAKVGQGMANGGWVSSGKLGAAVLREEFYRSKGPQEENKDV